MDNYKAFISHAHEDKERFVREFARKLMADSIDVWFDEWEIKLGDSLVKKIFAEGIDQCDIFMIILSKNSINKKWVQEELDSAVVKRVEEKTRIIPIIIDQSIEVPSPLRHLKWIQILDIENYKDEYRTILNDVSEHNTKPKLGKKPGFSQDNQTDTGLNEIESSVLSIIGNKFYAKDTLSMFVPVSDIYPESDQQSISRERVIEVVEILESYGAVKITRLSGGEDGYLIRLTPHGFVVYSVNNIDDYESKILDVVSAIVNHKYKTNKEIREHVNVEFIVINALLVHFGNLDYLHITELNQEMIMINKISGSGSKAFREMLHDA